MLKNILEKFSSEKSTQKQLNELKKDILKICEDINKTIYSINFSAEKITAIPDESGEGCRIQFAGGFYFDLTDELLYVNGGPGRPTSITKKPSKEKIREIKTLDGKIQEEKGIELVSKNTLNIETILKNDNCDNLLKFRIILENSLFEIKKMIDETKNKEKLSQNTGKKEEEELIEEILGSIKL